MTFIAHNLTVSNIIARAATLNGEQAVARGDDPDRVLQYYSALNEFLQAVGRTRPWWWLRREVWMATKSGTRAYNLRLQARASVVFSGGIALNDRVTVDGVAYTFTAATTTAAASAAALEDLVNSDADRQCQAYADGATCWLYWAGDDGLAKVVTDSVDAGSKMTTSSFAYYLEDFSTLLFAPRLRDQGALTRVFPNQALQRWNRGDGLPRCYALHGGLSTLQVYSAQLGNPDDVYLLELAYQARPSAILPDGRGDLDFPEEFHDLLPHAIKLTLKAGSWDESAAYGDEWMRRRLGELERAQVDRSPLGDGTRTGNEPTGFECYPRTI